MYSNLPLGVSNAGLILILVDQSEAMNEDYGETSKRDFAARAANLCIFDLISDCTSGEKFKDRCHICVIGYGGGGARVLVGGKPSQLFGQVKRVESFKQQVSDGAGGYVEIDRSQPIWVEPQASKSAPMGAAFDLTAELVRAWIPENKTNFPPVVINITAGRPENAGQTIHSAGKLTSLATTDGAVLLLNAHLGKTGQREIIFPEKADVFADDFGFLLFGISSILPPYLLATAKLAGYLPGAEARGTIVNSRPETFIRLISFGSSPVC